MTAFGALLVGVAGWCVVGFVAAQILSKGSGAHDGGGAMEGFFIIGGMGGIVGAGLGSWVIWRVLADPARMGMVGASLGGLVVVVLGIGIVFAMQPPPSEGDFPKGTRGELQVEVRFPASQIGALGKNDVVKYELRSYRSLVAVDWQRSQSRQEGDAVIVPGAFPVRSTDSWILGIMNGSRQLETASVGVHSWPEETMEWSPWTRENSGIEVRWRFAVLRSR